MGEICNDFKEHVENISDCGSIIKNLRPFEELLEKFAASMG